MGGENEKGILIRINIIGGGMGILTKKIGDEGGSGSCPGRKGGDPLP